MNTPPGFKKYETPSGPTMIKMDRVSSYRRYQSSTNIVEAQVDGNWFVIETTISQFETDLIEMLT